MEGLMPYITILKKLRYQVRELTSVNLALTALFDEEANRLHWKEQASRLKTIHSSVRQQMDRAKSSENAASYGNSKARLAISLGGLAVGGIIRMTSENRRLLAFSDHLLNDLAGEQRPFGTVLICVGPRGMPDDVQVISISRQARELKREESKVINELQEGGCLLFSEKAFSDLIVKLIDDVQEGRLGLPVSTEKLTEISTSSCLKLEAKKSG